MDLTQVWIRVTTLLNEAYEYLPNPVIPNGDYIKAEQDFVEFIEHNELELALDALEALGISNKVAEIYWEKLIEAADAMNLQEHKIRFEEYRQKSSESCR